MGIDGLEGMFRIACEETFRTLKQEKNLVFTLLDVFRSDPLYRWTVSPLEQNQGSNQEADQALFGVLKKLGVNSIELTVSELLNQATSFENLSRMYPGWQAWV
jgi:serine/threonine-protein kinase ATR